ncbi:hypothetical protein GCM10022408_07120 [Hymenobacter fastidiosus]|uniref:Uncharacterized protein n=1 Tax=Hymenobacter fastidiosus TaxID=486264 RepID=A0ABP7RLG5_9BACT
MLVLPLPGQAQNRLAAAASRQSVVTSSRGQALTVSGACAVLYAPDAAKISHLKQQYGEANFNTSAGDNHAYVARSRAYLQGKGIRIIETTATQLRFTTTGGAHTVLDLSSPAYSWGLLLFNGRTAPQEANLADPATDVQTVMKK